MIDKLDHLVETGITALELMPLADFAGSRNWGYDGVLWYAPDSAYGRPDDLKALIDAAHLRGLMVLLDVVYNHFGPEGNYLGRYAPAFFTEAQTPWGSAIDYRVPEVRAFAIENALHWLRDYRFDGLRLDAVNAIVEPGGLSLLHDLSAAAGELAAETGRHIHLVLENDDNRASLLDAAQDPPRGKYRAQWNDDYHHAWHVLLTGETQGYYGDYQQSPICGYRARAGVRLRLSGRAVGVSRRAMRGEPSGHLRAHRLRQFPAEPRPDRQPRARRPARKRCRRAGDRGGAGGHCCWRRRCPCCSWARNGARRRRSRSSAISAAISPTPSARAAAGEFAWAYAEYGDEVPDPLDRIDAATPPCSTGTSATTPAARQAADAGARPACKSAGRRSSRGSRARPSAKRMRTTTAC